MKVVNRFCKIVGAAIVVTAILALAYNRRHSAGADNYRPGDWVSYGVSRYVSSVAVGPQHAYFGTTNGILRYNIFRGQWDSPYTTSDGLAGNQVTVVAHDLVTGALWCATDYGVSRQNPASLRWTNYSKSEIGMFSSEEIISIGFDTGTNWFESRTRLFRQDKFGEAFVPAANQPPGNHPDIRWFGARSPRPRPLPHFFMPPGYLFDPAGAVQDDHLRRALVTGVINDDWGNMWLGTWGLGAMRADLNVERAELLEFGLANERVDALLFDDDGLWIGGLRSAYVDPFDESVRGITYWLNPDPTGSANRDWKYFDARYNLDMSSDEVHNFAPYQNKIYCATEQGINIYDKKKDRWRRLLSTDGLAAERVNDVLAYGEFLYAGTDLGLDRITIASIDSDSLEILEVMPDELRHVAIYDLERQHNLLWVATERGPFIFDMRKGKGGYLADNEGPRDEVTYAISFADSIVWIGTEYGVEAFDAANQVWLGAPARNRLPNIRIQCIVAGPEAVWVGSDKGVFKFHRRKKEWRRYSIEDGLIDNRVNAVALDDDLVWFGTNAGLTAFRWRVFHDFD